MHYTLYNTQCTLYTCYTLCIVYLYIGIYICIYIYSILRYINNTIIIVYSKKYTLIDNGYIKDDTLI